MSELAQKIRQRIQERGRITFSEFMELALYYPNLGYYASTKERVGAQGDFYTSPATHPVFGTLIAIQLEQMWQLMGQPTGFTIVEMGAGKGLLARDILTYATYLSPHFASTVEYITQETGSDPQVNRIQGQNIELPPVELRTKSLDNLTGCVLSNELLDAFPTHRVTVKDGQLKEVYVTCKDDLFVECLDEPSTDSLADKLRDEGVTLSEGYCTEINLSLSPWIEKVAHMLDRGFVLTIDYGYLAAELYRSNRKQGTLMSYYRHSIQDNPYTHVGDQDITSHVDFTSVIESGRKAGLCAARLISQREFLLHLGFGSFMEALDAMRLDHRQHMANRFAMLELIRPEGMGDFKVLIQGKGIDVTGLRCLISDGRESGGSRGRIVLPTVPLLTDKHTPLLSARYPYYSS